MNFWVDILRPGSYEVEHDIRIIVGIGDKIKKGAFYNAPFLGEI